MKATRKHQSKAENDDDASKVEVSVEISGHDRIARRAYELWMERGCLAGFDVENWRDAERWLENEERAESKEARSRYQNGP
jgi:hypothetical protein